MSSTKENREAERADLVSNTAEKSDAMGTFPAIEQPHKEQTHQATPVGATTGNALLRSSVITPPPGPEHTVDRGNKPVIWDDDYFERHSSIYQNHKSPCPGPRRKSAQAKNEGAELAAPEKNTLSRTPPSVETSATAEDPVCRLSSPVLSSSFKVHQEQQKPSSAEGILVRPDDGRIKARTESAPEKNKLSRAPLPAETTATAEDTVWRSSPPILSSSSEAREYLEKPVGEKLEARTKTAPEKNTLSRAPLPAETIATAEDPFWRSSPLILSNTSEAHGGQQNSSPATGNIEKPDDETIEARTETAPDVNQPLSKRPIPLDWSSSEPDRSSSSGGHQYQLSSGTVRELLEASYRKGEAWKGVPLGENPFLSKLPFPPAKSRGTDDEGVKAPQCTAPGEQNPYSSPPLPSSSVVSHQDFSPTPVCLPEPKTPGQTRKRILSSPRPPIPAQKILSSSRFLGVRFTEEQAEEDSRSFRYFSHVEVPLECHAARVQNQTAKLPPRKRKHAATEDDNGDGLAAQSQHRELPNPSPDSKIQKLPTQTR